MTRKLYRIPSLFALFLASLAVAGCGPSTEEREEARSIEIKVEEYKFSPSQITVKPGEELIIELRNEGKKEHSIEFDLPGKKPALERNVPPGQTGHLNFKAPSEPGTYPFFSPTNDDRKLGLEGHLSVTSKPARR